MHALRYFHVHMIFVRNSPTTDFHEVTFLSCRKDKRGAEPEQLRINVRIDGDGKGGEAAWKTVIIERKREAGNTQVFVIKDPRNAEGTVIKGEKAESCAEGDILLRIGGTPVNAKELGIGGLEQKLCNPGLKQVVFHTGTRIDRKPVEATLEGEGIQ